MQFYNIKYFQSFARAYTQSHSVADTQTLIQRGEYIHTKLENEKSETRYCVQYFMQFNLDVYDRKRESCSSGVSVRERLRSAIGCSIQVEIQ